MIDSRFQQPILQTCTKIDNSETGSEKSDIYKKFAQFIKILRNLDKRNRIRIQFFCHSSSAGVGDDKNYPIKLFNMPNNANSLSNSLDCHWPSIYSGTT